MRGGSCGGAPDGAIIQSEEAPVCELAPQYFPARAALDLRTRG